MAWKIELVHGPRSTIINDTETFEDAVEWVDSMDLVHHTTASRTYSCLEAMKSLYTHGNPEDGFVQYGTNYHWVTFTEEKEKDGQGSKDADGISDGPCSGDHSDWDCRS